MTVGPKVNEELASNNNRQYPELNVSDGALLLLLKGVARSLRKTV